MAREDRNVLAHEAFRVEVRVPLRKIGERFPLEITEMCHRRNISGTSLMVKPVSFPTGFLIVP